MALSQQRTFNPNLGEVVIGAFARCGVRRTELTQQHMADAQFEANLLQSDMQGDGIQLYEVTLETQDIVAGKASYNIDPLVVFMLDVYIRQNATVQGVQWSNNNASLLSWTNSSDTGMFWYESMGYNSNATPNYDYWINNSYFDTPWVNNGSFVSNWTNQYIPQNVVWANQNNFNTLWTNNFNNVEGWSGVPLPVPPPPPPPPVPPSPPVTVNPTAIDRIIVPFSRSDYAAVANKGMTGFPTSYWYDKLLQPMMYLWPVPNTFIPNGLQYYVMKRPCDADLADGAQLQIPYEYYDYYVWGLAERLAYIYAPDKVAMISPRRQQAWLRAMQASTENVPLNIDTMVGSYFRV